MIIGKPDERCFRNTGSNCDNCGFCEISKNMQFIFLDDLFCPRWMENECLECGRCL